MRVFLLNERLISSINKKEEISNDTFLITDKEADEIQQTLDNDGYFWVIDKYTIGYSGVKPNDDFKWNDELHKWEECEVLKEKRISSEREKMWKRIKTKRDGRMYSGVSVLVNNEIKWFHTDVASLNKYKNLESLFNMNLFKETEWKTMDGSFVTMTKEVYSNLILAIFNKNEIDFKNADYLYNIVGKSEKPLEVDITKGWSEEFNKPTN